jgi:hypothetical protein
MLGSMPRLRGYRVPVMADPALSGPRRPARRGPLLAVIRSTDDIGAESYSFLAVIASRA